MQKDIKSYSEFFYFIDVTAAPYNVFRDDMIRDLEKNKKIMK